MNASAWSLDSPEQLLSIFGSLLVLSAYALMVARPEKRVWYFSISMFGGMALTIVAVIYHNLGILFLELAWMAINGWGLFKAMRSPSWS